MRMLGKISFASLILFLFCIAGASANWQAYNDCIGNAFQNATGWTIYDGFLNNNTGLLKNWETNSTDSMPTVTFIMNPAAPVQIHADYGANPTEGTHAYEVFNGKVDFDGTILQHSGSNGWAIEITFTNLNPLKRYTFVGSAFRIPGNMDRISLVTIKDADAFINNSDSGGDGWVGTDTTKFLAVDNAVPGHVIRWDEIECGLNGSFTVRAEADSSEGSHGRQGYPLNGFMLEETNAPGNQPPIVNAGKNTEIWWPNNRVALDGSVIDDELGNPNGYLAMEWSKQSGPGNVSFEPDEFIENAVAVFSQPGTYVLKLYATDGEENSEDTVTITVNEPVCPVGDLNADCKTTMQDLVLLGSQWLDPDGCSGFDCADFNIDGSVDITDLAMMSSNWMANWTGSITVTIEPDVAVIAGAKWSVDAGQWLNSRDIVNDLPEGDHIVRFQDVTGWLTPDDQTVEVDRNMISDAVGVYSELPASALVINEFMAINSYIPYTNPLDIRTTVDGRTAYPDWLEIHNTDTVTLSLNGWYLTDDPDNPTKWKFPNGISLNGGAYLVVFASGKTIEKFPSNYPYVDGSGKLHTNFTLGASGEYLALVAPDGVTVAHEYGPEFPKQWGLISYGIGSNGGYGYLKSATPGNDNSQRYVDAVADTRFSDKRGYYDAPFDVSISTETQDAVIRYTLDCTEPTMTNGFTFTDPITITTTTCLRARAFKTDYLSSNIDSQTYVFLQDVLTQDRPSTEYPASWSGYGADYQMDPEVYEDPDYSGEIYRALTSIPTLSVLTDVDGLFGATNGIYTNTTSSGLSWERACSAELFDTNGSKFQINCGLRLQGGASRQPNKASKHSLSLRFRGGYGPSKLDYSLFNDSPVDSLDTLQLRAMFNNSWIHWNSGQRSRGSMIRDQWARDCLLEMGDQTAGRGSYVNLYLNGIYWGVYNIHERQEASHYAAYFGGDSERIDALSSGAAVDGDKNSWNALHSQIANAVSGGINLAEYNQIARKLDIDNLIDYMIVNHYGSNSDWDGHNWRAAGGGLDNVPWRIYSWDAERILEGVSSNRTSQNNSGCPSRLFQNLRNSDEFNLRFADRLHKHFFNAGAMTRKFTAQRWMKLATDLDMAIIAESARWGDYRRDVHQYSSGPYELYTKNDFWLPEQQRLIDTYFPLRSENVLNQYKGMGLYPNVAAPVFNQHGQTAANGFDLDITAAAGTIYYTLDGSDPRQAGGAAVGTVYSDQITLTKSAVVKARALNGGIWSALNEATFAVGPVAGNLRITEIMYNSMVGSPGDPEVEFVELINIGAESINLNLVSFANGIDFTFGDLLLAGGQRVIVVNDQTLFDAEYPGFAGLIAGEFLGSLDNGGEKIALQDAIGNNILKFDYNDTWFDITDGVGFSLTIKDPALSRLDHIEDGLAAHWKLDENKGAAVADSSGNNHNGTVLGNTLQSSSGGKINGAVKLDGNGDFVKITGYKGITGSNPRTITAWIKTDFANGEIVSWGLGGSAGSRWVLRIDEYGRLGIIAGAGATTATTVVNDGKWHHVAAVSDGGNISNVQLYVDGELDELSNADDRAIDTVSSADVCIGIFEFAGNYFNGLIDNVGIYGRTLTADEISSLADLKNYGDDKQHWRPSARIGGSPGEDDTGIIPQLGDIVINEVLAHSHALDPDWIELHNTTDHQISIGGWFLSDNNDNLTMYEIADDVSIPSGGHVVFYEDETFGNVSDPGCHVPFALSENGDTVYLHSGQGGLLTGYNGEESFGASETGVSLGRYQKSTGTFNFVALSSPTPADENDYPKVGPVVISEIMYAPAGDSNAEYVELLNISGAAITLYDYLTNEPWRFTDDGGFEFFFPDTPVTMADGERILLVKDEDAFDNDFTVPQGTQVFAWDSGSLSNGGERIQLSKPGDVDTAMVRQYIRIDRVVYDDDGLWPTEADEQGQSLTRIIDADYGNDVVNWQAANPTPGQ